MLSSTASFSDIQIANIRRPFRTPIAHGGAVYRRHRHGSRHPTHQSRCTIALSRLSVVYGLLDSTTPFVTAHRHSSRLTGTVYSSPSCGRCEIPFCRRHQKLLRRQQHTLKLIFTWKLTSSKRQGHNFVMLCMLAIRVALLPYARY